MIVCLSDLYLEERIYLNTSKIFVNMANYRIPELSWETGRELELRPPQLVYNTTATWGGIHQLDEDAVAEYQQDLFQHHLHSMPSLAPVTDPFLSAPTPPVADLLISASEQREFLQPSVLNTARNEFMMPIDNKKQLSPKTKGISQPSSVASASKTDDKKRKGKEAHVKCQNTKEAGYPGKRKREWGSSSTKKLHNEKHKLSEKNRRDKTSGHLKNLQTIVCPHIDKVDQVSILDGAIIQIKLLLEQVQKLSMKTPLNINANASTEECCIMPSIDTNQIAAIPPRNPRRKNK